MGRGVMGLFRCSASRRTTRSPVPLDQDQVPILARRPSGVSFGCRRKTSATVGSRKVMWSISYQVPMSSACVLCSANAATSKSHVLCTLVVRGDSGASSTGYAPDRMDIADVAVLLDLD